MVPCDQSEQPVLRRRIPYWTGEFYNYLQYENPALAGAAGGGGGGDKAGVVDQVKAAVCDNINLYIEKNEVRRCKLDPGLKAPSFKV